MSVAQLKAPGWTDTLMRDFLGDPDILRPNPHYRSAAPMRLYLEERVQAVEASEAFVEARDKRQGNKEEAAKTVLTKRRKLQEYVESLTIEVPALPLREVMKAAIDSYNGRQTFLSCPGEWASIRSDPLFLERITVNYVRHNLSDYEGELMAIFGKVGVSEGYVLLSEKVFAAIAASYPELQLECERQMEQRKPSGVSTLPDQ